MEGEKRKQQREGYIYGIADIVNNECTLVLYIGVVVDNI